jgi:hypothetical protein
MPIRGGDTFSPFYSKDSIWGYNKKMEFKMGGE